jgi:uncharacterized protein (TIGR03435 family)
VPPSIEAFAIHLSLKCTEQSGRCQRIPTMRRPFATAPILAAILIYYPRPCHAAVDDHGPSFAVASIRPSRAQVNFEHDGRTEISPLAVNMQDVTVATCIKWAYAVQDSQISGPPWLQSEHYDITARTDGRVTVEQLKLMMRTLLAERFQLTFHRQSKEMRSYVLTVAKSGHKLRESAAEAKPSRQNSATGTAARAFTMGEFADFIAGPLKTPVVDMTGLKGKYDFVLDFTPYLPENAQVMRPDYADTNGIIISALQGELGLKLESKRESVEVLVIDHVEKPSAN